MKLVALAIISLFFFSVPQLASQTPDDVVTITRRYDIRKRANDRYAGLAYGWESEIWTPYRGTWDLQWYRSGWSPSSFTARAVELERSGLEVVADPWRFDPEPVQGPAAPSALGFPWYPSEYKDYWEAPGWIVVDPRGVGERVVLPILVAYQRDGTAVYRGQVVDRIRARYAIRYRPSQLIDAGLELPRGLEDARGTREVEIFQDPVSGDTLFIRETLAELYTYSGGETYQRDGFLLSFYEHFDGPGLRDEADDIEGQLEVLVADDPEIDIRRENDDIVVTLENLLFEPELAQLVPGQNERIVSIADVLLSFENKRILVVGHTADVGSAESQQTLSVQRAQAVVELLQALGISPSRLLYEGRGGREPVDDNTTFEGRARNRRVEFYLVQ